MRPARDELGRERAHAGAADGDAPALVLRHHETRTAASRATACISSMPATG
jgi:hypothetical protein